MRHVLVIGAGSIGERHARCFLRTGRTEVSICEPQPELRDRIREEYAVTAAYATLSEARAKRFDAAVIATPAPLHVPMALELVRANVAVLIEKPLGVSLDGVDELRRLTESRGVPVGVAYVYRHHPLLEELRTALQSGDFGRPVQVVVVAGQHFPLYRPAYREIYYARHEAGGGAIQDALTHLINATEWLIGPVTRLVADAAHCVLDGVDVEDTAHVLTRHGAILGSFSLNQHQPPNESSITVHCERGALRFENHRGRWSTCRQPGDPWHVENECELERDELFIAQANAFLDVLDGAAPACSLDEAVQTLRVNLAALESVRSGTWQTIEATS